MDAYACLCLKKYTRVPPQQNLRGFRQAIAKLDLAAASLTALPHSPKSLNSPKPPTATDLEKTYAELVRLILSAQPISSNKTNSTKMTNQVSAAAAHLATQAVLFHLNFFKPNFVGSAHPIDLQKCLKEMTRLFVNKNRDYGNSFRLWGVPGLLVRLGDKILRLRQLTTKNYQHKVTGEKIPDTALDLANYALMLLMLLNEGRSPRFGE